MQREVKLNICQCSGKSGARLAIEPRKFGEDVLIRLYSNLNTALSREYVQSKRHIQVNDLLWNLCDYATLLKAQMIINFRLTRR